MSLLGDLLESCPPTAPAPAGLRRLVASIPDGPALFAAARRLGAVARFVRDDLRRVEEAAAYLTHPDLTIPADDETLAARHQAALRLTQAALCLAAEDRIGDLFAANRELRSTYVAAYQDAHDRYYAAVSPKEVDQIRTDPAYRSLARLSTIGAIAVPDDRVKVDRILAGAVPTPCRRRVDIELAWKPRCACGLALGDRLPELDRDSILSVTQRGVAQYLEELARPDVSERLEEATGDLATLGRRELADDLAHLVTMATSASGTAPADPDLAVLARLLDGELPTVVGSVLTGAQLIVTRDLATLREDLIGRRYTKRRILELLAHWVDPAGDVPHGGFVEVLDSSDAAGRHAAPSDTRQTAAGATVALLHERFPGVAALLPAHEAADAFWLAAWWGDRPAPPPWLPADLVADHGRVAAAAKALLAEPAAVAELAALDGRITESSVLGDRVATALGLPSRTGTQVAAVLMGERLFGHPVRLAATHLVRQLAGDWQLTSELKDIREVARHHPLLTDAEMEPLVHLADAAGHLAAIEHRLAGLAVPSLVSDLYPSHQAPVPELISRAELACAAGGLVAAEAAEQFRAGAARLLQRVNDVFGEAAADDFAGCLRIWEVGQAIVAPLLAANGRVAVLLIDAMRADLAGHVIPLLGDALPGRSVHRHWAVVPQPTRTAEAMAALALGRPIPAGSTPPSPGPEQAPFAHLGYEATILRSADRDDRTAELRALWASGPPISVAVAAGADERLHHTSVELAALLDEATTSLQRRVIPSLTALPHSIPLVLLADHGFRENPHWGRGPEGRYVHGGTTLEECVVPVVVFAPPTQRPDRP